MNPRAIVAIILAVSVLIFVGSGVLKAVSGNMEIVSAETAQVWADLIKVLIGGLIGYIAGSDK